MLRTLSVFAEPEGLIRIRFEVVERGAAVLFQGTQAEAGRLRRWRTENEGRAAGKRCMPASRHPEYSCQPGTPTNEVAGDRLISDKKKVVTACRKDCPRVKSAAKCCSSRKKIPGCRTSARRPPPPRTGNKLRFASRRSVRMKYCFALVDQAGQRHQGR